MPSKGGGGGGGGSKAVLQVPSGLLQSLSSETGVGQYATSLFDSLANLTNWASGQATGGTGANIPSFSSQAVVAGPQASWGGGKGGSDLWNTQFDPKTGLVTFTNPRDPAQTWTMNVNSSGTSPHGSGQPSSWGGIDPGILAQWRADYAANQGGGQAGAGGTPAQNQFLTEAWNQIESIKPLEQQTQQFTQNAQAEESQLFGQGENLFTQATTGTGLFPSQQALVNQAVESEKSKIDTQLAAEGLTSSTAKAVLEGQAEESGAATAGQLIQGNIAAAQQQIQLAQTASKLALGGQELSLGEATAMATAAAGLQSQLWTEAMQGYGILGEMIKTAASAYGIDVQGYSNILNADINTNQINAQLQEAQDQAANASSSSMGQGLGALFGMGGGGGGGGGLGGLFSGIGSLFGGAGATAGVLGSAGGASIGAGEAATAALGAAGGLAAF